MPTKTKNLPKLSKGEELYLARMAQKTGFPMDIIKTLALKERVPVTSFVILGGQPYITVSGLDRKLRNKSDDEKLNLKEIQVELIQDANKQNDNTARAKSKILFFDKAGFKDALKQIDPKNVDKETLEKLEGIYTESYEDEGWANPADCRAVAYNYDKKTKEPTDLLLTNVNMMACRRASSRAKRQATGCGMTSLDEVPITDTKTAEEIGGQRKARKEQFEVIEDYKKDVSAKVKKMVDDEIKRGLTETRANQIIDRLMDLKQTTKEDEKQK